MAPPREKIHIDRATANDAAEISALIQRTIRASNADDYDAKVIDALCTAFSPDEVTNQTDHDFVLICMLDSQLAGTAGSTIKETEASGITHHINSLFVDLKYQGQGLGRVLIAEIEKHARAEGAASLTANAALTAEAFYRALGFTAEGHRSEGLGDTIFMRKGLGDKSYSDNSRADCYSV
ncbi:MAG: GNAT family N-acetyltransferase [Pseudomonadota bacterium]